MKPSKYAPYAPTLEQEQEMHITIDTLKFIRKKLKHAKAPPANKKDIELYQLTENAILVEIAKLYLRIRRA